MSRQFKTEISEIKLEKELLQTLLEEEIIRKYA